MSLSQPTFKVLGESQFRHVLEQCLSLFEPCQTTTHCPHLSEVPSKVNGSNIICQLWLDWEASCDATKTSKMLDGVYWRAFMSMEMCGLEPPTTVVPCSWSCCWEAGISSITRYHLRSQCWCPCHWLRNIVLEYLQDQQYRLKILANVKTGKEKATAHQTSRLGRITLLVLHIVLCSYLNKCTVLINTEVQNSGLSECWQ